MERDPEAAIHRDELPEVVRFGPFQLDTRGLVLSRDGSTLPAQPKALKVLRCLLQRGGAVVLKDELLERIWAETSVTEKSLTEAVSRLRSTLGDDPQAPTYIETVHRRGYRFIGTFEPAVPRSQEADAPEPSAARLSIVHTRGLLWGLGGIAVGMVAILLLLTPSSAPTAVTGRFTVELGEGRQLPNLWDREVAISPDGRTVVFVGCCPSRLWLRPLDEERLEPLDGTLGAEQPFFSPDGRMVAFWTGSSVGADAELRTMALGNRQQQVTRAVASDFRARESEFDGGAWLDDGSLLVAVASINGGLWRLAEDGGEPVLLRPASGPERYQAPRRVPGRNVVLATLASPDTNTIVLVDLDDPAGDRPLLRDAFGPMLLNSGHLLFVRDGRLFAVRFDASRLEIVGAPVALADSPRAFVEATAQAAVSDNGTLVFAPAQTGPTGFLQLIDRSGHAQAIQPPADRPLIRAPSAFSPDGDRVTISDQDLWNVDPRGEAAPMRLTSGEWNRQPVWRPDGNAIAFSHRREGRYELRMMDLARGRSHVQLLGRENHLHPEDWTRDGRFLVFTEKVVAESQSGNGDRRTTDESLWVLPQHEGAAPLPLLTTSSNESAASLSPDDRWFAYHSDETGRWAVYVRPFPQEPDRHDPSGSGLILRLANRCGGWPVWSPDGDEIFFLDCAGSPRTLWSVAVQEDAETGQLEFGEPRALFEGNFHTWRPGPSYSVAPDGRFAMVTREFRPIDRLTVVVGLDAELELLMPSR